MSTEEYSIGYADGKRDGYNEGVVDGHQAATSRQEAKIKALVEALEKLACLGNGDKHGNSIGNCIAIAAIAAAKETSWPHC